jgi:sulfur dioxygenase
MYFRILGDEPGGLVSYLLADLDAQEALIIDPMAHDVAVIQALLAEHHLKLRAILLTHRHEEDAMAQQGLSAALDTPCLWGDQLADGALIDFGDEHVRVLATPGHTDHCRSFLWRDRLFCGGLLTADACHRRPTVVEPQAMWDNVMRKVFTLPPETLLFSAHAGTAGAVSNVMTQKRRHPWFEGRSRDDFLSLVAAHTTSAN